MTNIHKVRVVLMGALAVQICALIYLFGFFPRPEDVLWRALLDVIKIGLIVLGFSTSEFLASLLFLSEGDDFYNTSYSRYMESVWDSWKTPLGVSVCKGSRLGAYTLLAWLFLLVIAYAILYNACLVGIGGYENSFIWREKGSFGDNLTVLLLWTLIANLSLGFFYGWLVLLYRKNTATICTLVFFILGNVGLLWIVGGMQTFGWSGVLSVLYWIGIVFLGVCVAAMIIAVVIKLKTFKVITEPGSMLIQSLRGVKEGFCPIIPRMTQKEKSKYDDYDSID